MPAANMNSAFCISITIICILSFSILPFGYSLTSLKLTAEPSDGSVSRVWLGDQLKFTCVPKDILKKYPLVFKRPDRILSEKCYIFENNYHTLECDPPTWERAERFYFKIPKVRWDDRGLWFCFYSVNSSQHTLIVYAMGNVSLHHIELLDVNHSRMSNPPGTVVDTNAAEVPSYQHSVYRVKPQGAGTKESPYNLRPTAGKARFKMSCFVSCSSPVTKLKWIASNASVEVILNATSEQSKADLQAQCNRQNTTKEMEITHESVLINCSTFPLEGLSRISCQAEGEQYTRERTTLIASQLNQSVYILCPGLNYEPELTTGEMIAIALGGLLAILLLSIGCLIFRRHHKEDHLTSSHGFVHGVHV